MVDQPSWIEVSYPTKRTIAAKMREVIIRICFGLSWAKRFRSARQQDSSSTGRAQWRQAPITLPIPPRREVFTAVHSAEAGLFDCENGTIHKSLLTLRIVRGQIDEGPFPR